MNDKIGIKIGIATAVIVIAMLAMVPGVSAFAFETAGQIEYEDGTPCPAGWTVCEENLNQSYPEEPWCEPTLGDGGYIIWDYLVVGRAESQQEYARVNVTSPDGMWYGEATFKLEDVYDADWDHWIVDIVVEEVPYALACNCGDTCVNTMGWWHDGGTFNASSTPIQDAVNNATAGDTVCVKDGTYSENVVVNRQLTVRSENGSALTAVDGAGEDVFLVTANQVNIEGFTVTGATGYQKVGIKLSYVQNCNISSNDVSSNKNGIRLYDSDNNIVTSNIVNDNELSGIHIQSSNENVVSGNNVTENKYGIYLYLSNYNEITSKSAGNTVMNNTHRGIYLYDADDNEITCNLVLYNGEEGFRLYGGSTGNNISYNNIVENGAYNAGTGGWEWNFHNYQSPAVVAEDNYWGTATASIIAASINEESGTVDYEPFLSNPSSCAPAPPVTEKPDLIVDSVYLNPDCKHYYFANEPNVVDITVKNIGTGAAGPSNASVSGASGTSVAAVGALDPGQSQTVTITDTVARPAGEVVTATADCYGEVTESNETNNASQIVDGDGDNVINHGLKGKWLAEGYAGPDPGNMTTWKSYELHGDLNYSVGDSYYLSGYTPWEHYTANWTAGDLPIPDSATDVVEARLYVYYTWDKAWVMPDNVSTSFNGVNQDPYDVHYTDRRGYGSMASYNLPYGALVYNVTDDFDTTGNHANVTKLCTLTNQVSMRGMMLVVVYEDPNEPLRQVFVIEEYDNLYGKASYCTTPEEATARALFTGPSIDMGTMVNANLITVAPGASPNEGDLIFNDQTWTNVWNFAGTNGAEIGIDERNVTAYLESTENAVGFQSSGDWMEASNAFLVVEYETKPDLVISEIEPNCGGYLFGNESNEICAKIENIGGVDATAFNVSFVADGFSEEVSISGLVAGANTTVCVTDPTSRNAGDSVSITVTADCNAEVVESDETNNASTLATTVVNNGYKGKRYTGGEDITTWKTFELKGNLLYSLGDSYYLSAYYNPDWTTYNASWTASDLPVPCTATVEEARLFVPYTWDKKGVMQTYVSLSFNGIVQTLDAHYSDEKMHATSYPYGMLAYDVTNNFNTAGNVANLTNSYPGGDNVSMRGMLLVVIYADDSEPLRKIIMNEEFDLLYGGSSKCTTPEEATAYAPFGAIDLARVANATLITVAPGAGNAGPEGDLSFNGQIWTDAWTFVGTGSPTPQIGINETNVTAYMNATGNEADFRSDGDYMEASNAFLVVEYKEEPIVSYGDSVYFKRNVRLAWRALGEPNNRGAVMFRNAKIAIELEETISDCEKVSVWVRRVAARPPTFEVGVSSDGSTWTSIGTETCTSFAWTRYDFTGDWDNVKYIGIRKPGGFWIPRLMGLDAVSAEGWN